MGIEIRNAEMKSLEKHMQDVYHFPIFVKKLPIRKND